MRIEVTEGYKGIKAKKQIYETVEEICTLIKSKCDFHDGTVERLQLDEKGNVYVEVEFYEDKYHYFFGFENVTEFAFDIDVKQNWIWEVTVEKTKEGVHVYFDQGDISITAGTMTLWHPIE